MYKSVSWEVIESSEIKSSTSVGKITLTPSGHNSTAWARVKAVFTNHYGKTTEREIWVAIADSICTGLTVTPQTLDLLGTSAPYQLNYSTTGSEDGYITRFTLLPTTRKLPQFRQTVL